MALPRRLNFGSGKTFAPDMLNIDILAERNPDVVLDLGKPFPFGETLQTRRFGEVRIEPGAFDYILADNVMEHVPDLIAAMTNALHLLAEGGILDVRVPYDLSHGAWSDPTHVRAFNERSWVYYCEWAWYVGWFEHRFDVADQTCILSPYGQSLAPGLGNDISRIAVHPRAVDELQVQLKKRALTPEEQTAFREAAFPGSDQAKA